MTGTHTALLHVADRLLEAIDSRKSPVCVGIDPVFDRLPARLRSGANDRETQVQAIASYTRDVLEAVHKYVPCVKFQSACFERYGWQGVRVLDEMMAAAHDLELAVILDAKRGDIGISAAHYAAAAFAGAAADWLTINAYLGDDGIEPFLQPGVGAFALVRTSNPGGDAVQRQTLCDGSTVAQAVARMIARLGASHVGTRGYSALGAVVGATKPEEIAALRELMPQQLFLVPGYGAQGGTVADILPCFKDGAGAIITASRSVIYAFEENAREWQATVEVAAQQFAEEVGSAVGLR